MSHSKTLLKIKVGPQYSRLLADNNWRRVLYSSIDSLPLLLTTGFDAGKLGDTLFEFFGPGTVYEKARQQSGSPIQGPWTNHCLKIMIANRENGVTPAGDKNSKDPDGLCKAVALVGLLTDVDNITDKVPDCVQTAQVC